MPYRTGAPARMAFQDWGATKQNVNEAYFSYTAILGTMARIYDISKQYARFSAGSAEQDVLDELTRAAILGEAVQKMDSPAPATATSNTPSGNLVFIFTNEHTDAEIVFRTGDFARYGEDSERVLEYIYPPRRR